MRKYFNRYTFIGAFLGLLAWIAIVPRETLAGIIQAIIPAAVPTANKQGNGSLFQLSSGAVTNGHCGSFDGNGNIVDSGVACSSSGAGTPGSTFFSSTTQAGPSNTASQTSLIGSVSGSTTIAANTFTNGAYMLVEAQGFYSLPAVADSLTLRLKCGSTVLGSASATLSAGVLTNGAWRMWLGVTAIGTGASGAFNTNGVAEFTGSALTASELKVLNTSNVSFDFTTSCAMDVTAQWGAAQSGESITGTGVTAYVPGAPVTSVGGATGAVKSGFQGNGTLIQLSTGSTTSGNCVKFDANGNTVDAGAACSSGFFSGSITPIVTADWSALGSGCATSTVTGVTGGNAIQVISSTGSANTCGMQRSIAAGDFSKVFTVYGMVSQSQFTSIEIGFTDGTKVEYCGLGGSGSAVLSTTGKANNLTGSGQAAANGGTNYSGFGAGGSGPSFWRLKRTGTNLSCDYSPDGANYINVFNDTSPHLTASALYFGTDPRGATTLSTGWLESYQ